MPLTLSGTNGVSGIDGTASTPSLRGSDLTGNGIVYGTDTVQIATGGTTAVTVDSSGNMLVGTTSQVLGTARLAVNATALCAAFKTSTSGEACYVTYNAATSGNNQFLWFYTESSATFRGSIEYNRGAGLIAYNTSSDYRIKDTYGSVDNSGEIIDALKVYRGKMHGATIERPMFIAHEAKSIVPYAVTGEKDELNTDGTPKYQQMDHSSLVPLLVAELQSLRNKISSLEAKLDAAEARIAALEAK